MIEGELCGKQAVEFWVHGAFALGIVGAVAIAAAGSFVALRESPVARDGRVQQHVRRLTRDLRLFEALQCTVYAAKNEKVEGTRQIEHRLIRPHMLDDG